MSDKTSIEWTRGDDGTPGATWNPVTGCTEVSPGCDHCYAKTFAERWRGTPGHHFEQGFDVVLRPERLDQPLRWKKPRRVFVNSMSDLFHDSVPTEYIARVFAAMALAPQHTFQLLTKRHARMRSVLSHSTFPGRVAFAMDEFDPQQRSPEWRRTGWWPLPNVWLGVSVENQQWADIRIPALLETPAAVRWISAEPLLGPVDLSRWLTYGCPQCERRGPWTNGRSVRAGDEVDEYWCQTCGAEVPLAACVPPGLSWIVCGGESGPGSRPMHPDWVRSLRDQCSSAGIAYFHKQNGQYGVVLDRPAAGDLWLAPDGATTEWQYGDGYVRRSGEEFCWPASRTVLMRRARSKHDAGRLLDGRTWDEYPEPSREVSGV